MIRNQKNKILLAFGFLVLICNITIAQNAISYNDFVNAIKLNFPLTKYADNISLQGTYQLNAARGNYDPAINAYHENKFYSGKNYFSVAHAELRQPIFTNQ